MLSLELISSIVLALREKCTYSELFWSTFSPIRTEYGEILCIFSYSVQRENEEQNKPECEHFLRSLVYYGIEAYNLNQ